MDVSVCMPTWNNAEQLRLTLDELGRCSTDGFAWEVVVCTNNCTDHTSDVLDRFRGRLPLVVVNESRQGVAKARNTAFANASGALIVMTDDDVFPGPRWLSAYVDAYRRHGESCFYGGPIVARYEDPHVDPHVVDVALPSARGYSEGTHEKELHEPSFIGPNWAAPAPAIRRLGGFDPNRGLNPSAGRFQAGEESILQSELLQAGYRAWYIPDATVDHFVGKRKTEKHYVFDRLEETAFDGELHRATNGTATLARLAAWTAANGALHCLKSASGVKTLSNYRNWRTGKGLLRARAVKHLMYRGQNLYKPSGD